MIAKHTVLSNIISFASDNILRICFLEPLMITKKCIVLLHTSSAYNSLLVQGMFVIPGNVCEQAEGMLKPVKTLALTQLHVEKIL